MVQNPWTYLNPDPPFLLRSDAQAIRALNAMVDPQHRIHDELLPEPYLGHPDAEILLLNLNPGFSELDIPFYERESIKRMWKKNILHEPQAYPFYLLDPAIQEESGPKWWATKLKEPIQLAGRKKVAASFFCVEYFPYHSARYRPMKHILESQKYSFHLVKTSMKRNALIILMRGERYWLQAIPDLDCYPKLFRLNSAQNVSISRKNCPTGFPILEKVLLR